MTLRSDIEENVAKILRSAWTTRSGIKVPENTEIGLGNDGVRLDAVVLYADLAESTALVETHLDEFAAEIYKTYLYCAARIIRANDGVITAYDGDRVMAVYLGKSKNSNATKTGLQISRAVSDVVNPALVAQYPSSKFVLKQKVGVASSELLVARTGIRGSNDLVWVGNAANHAAKMAALPTNYSSYITADVYGRLNEKSKYKDGEGTANMWTDLGYQSSLGFQVYGSNWMMWY